MYKGVCVLWHSSNVLLSLCHGDVRFMDGIVVTCVPVTKKKENETKKKDPPFLQSQLQLSLISNFLVMAQFPI
jgi:hypothetical protein